MTIISNTQSRRLVNFLCSRSNQTNKPDHEKTCFMPYANNKDADQPSHPRSLISVLIVHFLDSTISIVAILEI